MILCQQQHLLEPTAHNSDGSEFYFQNHAEAYNNFAQKNGTQKKIKFALLGVAAVAGGAGIILLIRNGLIERTLDKASYLVDEHGNKVDPKLLKGKNDDKEVKYFYQERWLSVG